MEKIKFKMLSQNAKIPTRATGGSAGFDLYTQKEECCYFNNQTKIDFGISVQIPEGYVGLLAIRSGKSAEGLSLSNSVGIIDSDYRGPIIANVVLTTDYNPKTKEEYPSSSSLVSEEKIGFDILQKWERRAYCTIDKHTRLCQLVVVPCLTDAELVAELDETDRGEGGFGSTGQ